jgi:hypothetical protein
MVPNLETKFRKSLRFSRHSSLKLVHEVIFQIDIHELFFIDYDVNGYADDDCEVRFGLRRTVADLLKKFYLFLYYTLIPLGFIRRKKDR